MQDILLSLDMMPWVFGISYADNGFMHYVTCSWLLGNPVVHMSTLRPDFTRPVWYWEHSGWHGIWTTVCMPTEVWIWVRLNYQGRNDRLHTHAWPMSRGRIMYTGGQLAPLEFGIEDEFGPTAWWF